MNSIVPKIPKIEKNNYYLEQIINCFFQYQIISKEEFVVINYKMFNALKDQLKEQFKNKINTIPVKEVEVIYKSMIWTMGVYLKKYSSYEIIEILLKENITNLYQLSLKYIGELFSKTKFFYETVFKHNLIKVNNYFYNSTLKDGMEAFFKVYKMNNPEDIKITLDYMPLKKKGNYIGIELISNYLNYINFENIFCKRFNALNINALLKDLYNNSTDLSINIFEEVFLVSLLLKYSNQDIFSLKVSNIDIDTLHNDFDKGFYDNKIKNAFISLKEQLEFNTNVENYLNDTFTYILARITILFRK